MNKAKITDRIKAYFGVLCIAAGIVSCYVAFYFDKTDNIIAFLVCLIAGIWAFAYGMFAAFTRKPIYSLYYPTVSIALIAFPPCLAAWLTRGYADTPQEWIQAVSTCLSAALGITLFCVFLALTYTRPQRKRREFVNANGNKFRLLEESEEGYFAVLQNKKNDRARIGNWVWNKHKVTIEKWIQEESATGHYDFYQSDMFVEYHNAFYFAAKTLIDLCGADDGRTEHEFDKDTSSSRELSVYLFGLNKLLEENGFKERFRAEQVQNPFAHGDKLVLKHLKDAERNIEFLYDVEGTLGYLQTHRHFYFENLEDTESNILEVFDYIKGILTDEIVVDAKRNMAGLIVSASTYDLRKYSAFRKCLKRRLMNSKRIRSWSGRPVEEIIKSRVPQG